MKLKNIYMFCGAVLLGTLALTSCSEDKIYDFDGIDYQRVFIRNAHDDASATIVKTPVGYIKIMNTPITAAVTKATSSATHVQFAIDNSKVEEYNKANGTSYLAAPEAAVSLSKTSLTINPDKDMSADTIMVTFSSNAEQLLTDKTGYVIPITITACDNDYTTSTNLNTKYIIVGLEETAVRAAGTPAEMLGTQIASYTGWTSTPNGFQDLFGSRRRYTVGTNPGVFTLDMQSSINLTGIAVYCYYANYAQRYGDNYKPRSMTVEISPDGTSFTNLGKLEGADLYVDGSGYIWYDLYGPMPCRYMRVTIEWAPAIAAAASSNWRLSGFMAYAE
ncbi:MAG: DUF1735 domain-containing protein [Prevotella sp.]|nr:DUF1735 domain-containing protein [Prevotella sp.]